MIYLVFGVLLALLVLIALTKITVFFSYRDKQKRLRISAWGISFGGKAKQSDPNAPSKQAAPNPNKQKKPKETDDGLSVPQRIKRYHALWKQNKKHIGKALRRLGKKTRIRKMELSYHGGFEDAAVTAVTYGAVSALIYEFAALIQMFLRTDQIRISVVPDFQHPGVTVETEWEISLRIWQIFYAGSALIPLLFRKKTKKL